MRRSLFALAALVGVACGSGDDGDPSSPTSSSGGDSSDEQRGAKTGLVHAVTVARTTAIPKCTVFVDPSGANGASKTLAAGVKAVANGGVVCVAEGTYTEKLRPGAKFFTLAGGFKAGDFQTRDSAKYVSKAQGNGTGAFLSMDGEDVPKEGELTAVDGFEITGYAQAIVRDTYFSQNLDITNDYIHDNACKADVVGAGFSLNNVSGKIIGNVFVNNACGRGGAGALFDSTGSNAVVIANNRFEKNAGIEPESSHGGALYLLVTTLTITGNELTSNTATGWGGGLYVGGAPQTRTKAALAWNVYRDNRAGSGGGFFCDDSATCNSDHEIYDQNCGGNIYLDCGPGDGPTVATFDHLTNVRALAKDCTGPGPGVVIDKDNTEKDDYTFTNALFWGNAQDQDFATSCVSGCKTTTVNVRYSNVQTRYLDGGVKVTFGEGNANADPLFVDIAKRDYHLRSKNGHWTAKGYAKDDADSPALGAGDPKGLVKDQPERAGTRTELGAYGNSPEASYVR